MQHKSCLICNSENIQSFIGSYETLGLKKCVECSFVFMGNIPSESELNVYYSNYSYSEEIKISPITIKRYNELLDEFDKFRLTGRILDVGTGRGWFLTEAKKLGWEVYATEYSEIAIEKLKERGIKTISGKLEENSFEKNYFDVITSFEVIEHINNPIEEVKLINSFLRKGGLFYCTTPNFNSVMRLYLKEKYNVICYPEHLSYYTPKTLNFLLKSHGFKKLKTITSGISLNRIDNSTKKIDSKSGQKANKDEELRIAFEKNRIMAFLKFFINSILSLTGLGMALKTYHIKK